MVLLHGLEPDEAVQLTRDNPK